MLSINYNLLNITSSMAIASLILEYIQQTATKINPAKENNVIPIYK